MEPDLTITPEQQAEYDRQHTALKGKISAALTDMYVESGVASLAEVCMVIDELREEWWRDVITPAGCDDSGSG